MNQKVSWALLIGGLAFFLGQSAELLAKHSTWNELMTPASTADMLRLFATVIPMIAGALGINMPSKRELHKRDHKAVREYIDNGRRPPAAAFAFVVLLAFAFGAPACATVGTASKNIMHVTQNHDPVQVTVLAADSVDAANQLGELVEQMRATAHKLHQAKVLPVEADNAVQRAAIGFADAKDVAVQSIANASTALQVTAAAAPLVGYATTIANMLAPVAGAKLPGAAGLLASQLPAILNQASHFTKTLGGK
jgi:hypothetical protein